MTSPTATSATQVQVSYDRFMPIDPVHDSARAVTIVGVTFGVSFAQTFEADPGDETGEPAGAAELNGQLRMSFTPGRGFETVSGPGVEWEITDYWLDVEDAPGWLSSTAVSREEFEEFFAAHEEKFRADPSLQSGAYWLSPVSM